MSVAVMAFGLLVGLVTGIVGAGGAIIAVPALVYVAGVSLETAISTSLVMGSVTPIAALLPRLRGGVDWRAVAAVAAGGIPAAFIGTKVGAFIPADVLLLAFAALMVVAGVQMLRPRPSSTAARAPRFWIARGLAVGLLVGFLTGLLGVGGGFITVPALILAFRMPIKTAIGTSLAVTVINAAAGVVAHAGMGSPDWAITLAFGLPAVIGAVFGARLSTRLSGQALQVGFAVLIFVTAALTVAQVLLS